MKTTFVHLDRWLGRGDMACAWIASAALLVMMVVTFADVFMRYLLNAPLQWGFDLITNYLLAASFFFGFSFALWRNEHVAVDFFARRLRGDHYHRGVGIGYLTVSLMFAAIIWFGAHETWTAWANDEGLMGVYVWPTWPAKAIVPLGLLPLFLRLVHRGTAHLLAVRDPQLREQLRLDLSQDLIPKE